MTLSSFIVCPNLILMKGSSVLLLRCSEKASLFPGHWHCVTGKMNSGETPKQTIKREAFEEIGIEVDPILGTTIFVQTRGFQKPELIWQDLSLFFVSQNTVQESYNKESHLHDAMEWFDVNDLPELMIPVVRFGIEICLRGESYGEFLDL